MELLSVHPLNDELRMIRWHYTCIYTDYKNITNLRKKENDTDGNDYNGCNDNEDEQNGLFEQTISSNEALSMFTWWTGGFCAWEAI